MASQMKHWHEVVMCIGSHDLVCSSVVDTGPAHLLGALVVAKEEDSEVPSG